MQHSQAVTQKSASNLALAFIMLPQAKRDAMTVLYSFCREVDDVTDEDAVPTEERRRQLGRWREDLKRACGQERPQMPTNVELQPVIHQFGLPFELFDELITGCESDLTTLRYENYETLEQYCYRVASVVGLLSIQIFGQPTEATKAYAVHLGKALQLTNILRDVKNDAERGRIYLPQEVLKKYGVSEAEILEGRYTNRFVALAESVAERAEEHFRQARATLPAAERKTMVAAELMGTVYWHLLQRLRRERYQVFGAKPISLSKVQKIGIIFLSWVRRVFGEHGGDYGTN